MTEREKEAEPGSSGSECMRKLLSDVQAHRFSTMFRVLILRTGIAGLHRRLQKYGDYAEKLLDQIRPGDILILHREPDNDADPFAVSVHTLSKLKLGYLPRFKNESPARLMDAGFRLIAYVDAPPQRDIEWSATEDIRVPIAVYLIL